MVEYAPEAVNGNVQQRKSDGKKSAKVMHEAGWNPFLWWFDNSVSATPGSSFFAIKWATRQNVGDILPNQLGTPVLKHPIGSDPLIATHDLCNGTDHGLFWSVSWCRERRAVSYHTHYLILREHQNFLKTVVLPTTISKSPQSWHLILTRVLEIFLRYPKVQQGLYNLILPTQTIHFEGQIPQDCHIFAFLWSLQNGFLLVTPKIQTFHKPPTISACISQVRVSKCSMSIPSFRYLKPHSFCWALL